MADTPHGQARVAMKLDKPEEYPVNAWRVINGDGSRVYGQAVKASSADERPAAWFMPARGYMVQRAEELEAIAALLRSAPELKP